MKRRKHSFHSLVYRRYPQIFCIFVWCFFSHAGLTSRMETPRKLLCVKEGPLREALSDDLCCDQSVQGRIGRIFDTGLCILQHNCGACENLFKPSSLGNLSYALFIHFCVDVSVQSLNEQILRNSYNWWQFDLLWCQPNSRRAQTRLGPAAAAVACITS